MNYKFVTVDVGSYGKEGDSGIFEKSIMGRHIRLGKFPFPVAKPLPGSDIVVPRVIVADEVFRLSDHVTKPYPKNQASEDTTKAVYNYRLCRARRVSENAFAILCQEFRIFYSAIALLPETTDLAILATCCLHNMLRDDYLSNHTSQEENEQSGICQNMLPLARTGGFNNRDGFEIRNKFRTYFTTPQGSIEWQQNCVRTNITS